MSKLPLGFPYCCACGATNWNLKVKQTEFQNTQRSLLWLDVCLSCGSLRINREDLVYARS